jgi:L-amino acid N-acyltransferase YncA
MIRYAKTDDAAQVCEIYNHYVLGTSITFEEQPVSIDEMGQRIDIQSLPWFVWEQDKNLKGFCYASKWKGRCAYRHSVESTVYLRADSMGRGIGSELYRALLDELRRRKFHTGYFCPTPRKDLIDREGRCRLISRLSEVGEEAPDPSDGLSPSLKESTVR